MCEQERERERERERVRVCEYAEEGDIETANVCERVEWRKRGESGDTLTFPLMRKRSVLSLTPPNERSIKTPPKVKTAFFLDVIKNSENVFQARLVVLQQELFCLAVLIRFRSRPLI